MMKTKPTTKHLELALLIATKAHFGQEDRSGQPYIFHPLRVMENCMSLEAKIAALLQDVVEDTALTFDDLKQQGIPSIIVETLTLLTHDENTDYMDYIRNLSHHPIAREVKKADLRDNINIFRLNQLTENDFKRLRKYHEAWLILNQAESTS